MPSPDLPGFWVFLVYTHCGFSVYPNCGFSVFAHCGFSVYVHCGFQFMVHCGFSVYAHYGFSAYAHCGFSVYAHCGFSAYAHCGFLVYAHCGFQFMLTVDFSLCPLWVFSYDHCGFLVYAHCGFSVYAHYERGKCLKLHVFARSPNGSPSQLFSTLMILKAACQNNVAYIDRLITTFMKVMHKMAREHLQPTTQEATPSQF